MGPFRLLSSSVLIGIDPHSGSVYPYSGCLCYEGMEGEIPDNHGDLKVVFQKSFTCHRGIDPHSGSVCSHSGWFCCEGGGRGPLINMGPLKLFFSSFLRRIHPHSGSVYPHSGCVLFYRWKPL